MISKPLRGIIPPLVTPMLDENTLDLKGLEHLLNHVIAGGVSGIFILGTSGEAQNLSYAVRKELIRQTCRIVEGRVPILVGISDTSFVESISLANKALEYGADALVATPPFYYTPGQAELIQYYGDLADQLPLPLFLYNMPSHVKVMIEPETIVQLSKHKNIIGLKDSSANGVYLQKVMYLLQDRPDFTILVGPEEMTAGMVLMGAHGGVNGGANIYPELYVSLYQATCNKDFKTIAELQPKVMNVSLSLYNIGKYASSYIKGLKTALNLKGICSDFMPEPFHKFNKAEREFVEQKLAELDALILK
jgi:4-hydroxy-tetrahydrodipicolinate synthase